MASLLEELSRTLIGYPQRTPREENSNAAQESNDPESPINVLNKEALKIRPVSSTASPKSTTKRTRSNQERPRTEIDDAAAVTNPTEEIQTSSSLSRRTRSAAAEQVSVTENLQSPPRGTKRSREVEAEDNVAWRSPRTKKGAKATRSSRAIEEAQAPPHLEGELALDPRRRLRRENPAQDDEPSNRDQHSPDTTQISLATKQSRPKNPMKPRELNVDGSVIDSQQPMVEIPTRAASKLRKPATVRHVVNPAPVKRGEEVYDFDVSASPEQHRTLPPVGEKTSEKRGAKSKRFVKTGATHDTPAASEPHEDEDDVSKEVAPRKRGRPRKSTQQQPLVSSRSSRNTNQPRKSVPARIEASEGVVEDQERTGDRAAAEDDDRDAHSEGQSDTRTPRTATQATNEEDAEYADINPALLGEHEAWNEICKAARKNRVDKDEDSAESNTHRLASHVTKTLRDLSKKIKEASRIYVDLIKGKNGEEAERETNDKLSDTIEDLESQIENIREFDIGSDGEQEARSGREEIIQDIYKRGVPDMVYLLKIAIVCRSSIPPEIYGYQEIQEIMRLQNMTVRLCSTAVNWTVKPHNPNKPIIRNVRSVVFPLLRDRIRKTFAKETQRLWVVEKKQRNREKTQARLAQSIGLAQEAAELEAQQKDEDLRRMEEDIRQTQEDFRAKLLGLPSLAYERRSVSLQPRYPSHQPEHHDTLWTLDEERELMIQLQKRRSRHLPGELRRPDLHMY